jgi:hypothetical protein
MAHQRPIVLTPQILPAKSPELNPAGQAWREIRQKCPGTRVFSAVEDLDDAVADAWMRRIKNKNAIQSLCAYDRIMHIPIPKRFSVKPSIGEAIAVNTYPEFAGNHSGLGISCKIKGKWHEANPFTPKTTARPRPGFFSPLVKGGVGRTLTPK